MPKTERHYVHQILRLRKSAVELVFVAVVLAFGVNIASGSIQSSLGLPNSTMLWVGAALCLLSFAYGTYRLSASLSMSLELEGVLLVGEENQVIEIDRYRFSEETSS